MILVTGSDGFIGKHLVAALRNERSGENFCVADPRSKNPEDTIDYWIGSGFGQSISAVFHLGAISDTTCEDAAALNETNVWLTTRLAQFCHQRSVPFIYASSASVFGNGEGPLNAYARSKAKSDFYMETYRKLGALNYGLRFHNVYGTGEAHKGKQASLPHQLLHGLDRIFLPETQRDFVHVSDVVSVILWMWKNKPASGIYDVGTGDPRSILDVVAATGKNVREVPMPESLRGKYQTFTKADLTKLRAAGYDRPFLSLEEGVAKMREAERVVA